MRTIITITIILWSANAFSQIKSHGLVEIGYKNGSNALFYDRVKSTKFEYPANTFYADIELDFKWKFIRFKQILRNNFFYDEGRTFSTIDIEFITDISFEYKKVAVGYQHSCLHPVISDKSDLCSTYRRGSEDRIYFRIKW